MRANFKKNLLQGRYETYRPGGSPEIVTTYRKGLLHGSYKKLSPEGKPRLIAQFVKGKRHGKAKVYSGKEIISTQNWKKGELIELDGVNPYPYSLNQIRSTFAVIQKLKPVKPRNIRKPPQFKPPTDDPHAAERIAALHKLQEYRFLCRLPYKKMWLNPEWLVYCDAAAEVFRMNGGISHTPKKPDGCDYLLYSRGQIGAKSSNISGDSDLVRSVDSYMDDSDARNLNKGVGHRQFCLNPRMVITGFGKSTAASAMWAHDTTGLRLPKQLTICYPPSGYLPVTHFGPNHAWSINLHPWDLVLPGAGQIKVRVFEMDEDCVKAKKPL